MENKKGISLVILIITIAVSLILSAVIIQSLSSEENVMKDADEMQFKTNVSNYNVELEDYISKLEFKNNGRVNLEEINVEGTGIRNMIPSIEEEHIYDFIVKEGSLKYKTNVNDEYKKWADEVLGSLD